MNREPTPTAALIDPGWLFLLAGVAILGATVLIPAAEDLESAGWQRERAFAVEKHREARLARYTEYLDALETPEPSVVLSLAESQLNQIPADRDPVPGRGRGRPHDLSVFPGLEPPALELPEHAREQSILARWTTGPGRVWLLGGGALSVLLGLLPPSRGWSRGQAAL